MAGDPMTQLLMSLMGSSGKHPVDPTQPWNPAAGIGMSPGGGGVPSGMGAQPLKPLGPDASAGQQMGNAIMPQTMAGKGGASGG